MSRQKITLSAEPYYVYRNAQIKTVVKKMRKIKVRKQTADVHKPAVSGGSIDFTDVLLLLKIDGEWKCVAKAYNQNPNTIKK